MEYIQASRLLKDGTKIMEIVKKYLLTEHMLHTKDTFEFDKTRVIRKIMNYYN